MGRGLLRRRVAPFLPRPSCLRSVSRIVPPFGGVSRSAGQITHVLLTRLPLPMARKPWSARLACLKHAASVRPEPGSNSQSSPLRPPSRPRVRLSRPPALLYDASSASLLGFQRSRVLVPCRPASGRKAYPSICATPRQAGVDGKHEDMVAQTGFEPVFPH